MTAIGSQFSLVAFNAFGVCNRTLRKVCEFVRLRIIYDVRVYSGYASGPVLYLHQTVLDGR